jgi:hypothetical protein
VSFFLSKMRILSPPARRKRARPSRVQGFVTTFSSAHPKPIATKPQMAVSTRAAPIATRCASRV